MSLFDENGRILISPSRLKTWQECPMKWRAVYLNGIRMPPSPSLVFGSAIHKALEAQHRASWMKQPVTPEELEEVFAATLQTECAPIGMAPVKVNEVEMRGQAKKLIELYLAEYRDEVVAAAELSLSAPLVDLDTGEDLGAQLVGVIDLVTEDRRVIDLKSSARTTDLFDLTISHAVQLDAYRYLMLHSAGKEPEGLEIRMLVRKKLPELNSYRLPKRSGFKPFLDLCRRYIAFVHDTQPILPRPGFFCGDLCPAYHQCRAFHGLEVPA